MKFSITVLTKSCHSLCLVKMDSVKSHIIVKSVKEFISCTLRIPWPICVKFSTVYFHITSSSGYEFRQNLCSEIHDLIKDVREVLRIFSALHPIWIKYVTEVIHKYWVTVSFVKIRAGKDMHYFGLYRTFHLCCPVFVKFSIIRLHTMIMSVCEFRDKLAQGSQSFSYRPVRNHV